MSPDLLLRVIVESPYAAPTPEGREENLRYARACVRDCIRRGEAPLASHLLYTQMLRDEIPDEREAGMRCGFAWTRMAELVAVYTDRGLSNGMREGIQRAEHCRVPVEFRSLDREPGGPKSDPTSRSSAQAFR